MQLEHYKNEEETNRALQFGSILVTKYLGVNTNIKKLNTFKEAANEYIQDKNRKVKYIGSLVCSRTEKTVWYFYGIDGEKYRINETEKGIENKFKCEFKRTDGGN